MSFFIFVKNEILKKKNVYDEVQLGRMQHYQPYDRSWKLEMNCMINGLII